MNSKEITLKAPTGGHFNAYVSTPPTGKGPGILLIQEIFGVNEHIRAVADQYAMDGFTVLAPDVFWRVEPGVNLGYDSIGFGKGLELMGKMDFPLAIGDLLQAAAYLRGMPEVVGKIASLGYCMGGVLSYAVGSSPSAVDAAVCYYGGGIHNHLDRAAGVQQPMLMHFAEKDAYIPPSAVESIQRAFESNKGVQIFTYPDVDHGFNCWSRGMYNQKASSLARGRTLEFLSRHIA